MVRTGKEVGDHTECWKIWNQHWRRLKQCNCLGWKSTHRNLIQVKEPLTSLGLSYSECSLSFQKARLQAQWETDGGKAGISRHSPDPFLQLVQPKHLKWQENAAQRKGTWVVFGFRDTSVPKREVVLAEKWEFNKNFSL